MFWRSASGAVMDLKTIANASGHCIMRPAVFMGKERRRPQTDVEQFAISRALFT